MCNHFLEHYTISLIPLSPVFIGSGQSYNKKEYIFLKDRRKILMPDLHKLFQVILANDLTKSYEEFFLSKDKKDLGEWLRDHAIDTEETASWVRYFFDLTEEECENISLMEIQSCMKDGYGNPYIPGSSLKGAIRTAILGGRLAFCKGKEIKGKYQKVKKQLDTIFEQGYDDMKMNSLKDAGRNIEQFGFHQLERHEKKYLACNDYMGAVRISDSKPLSVKNLTLCRKIDVSRDGAEHKINLLRESVYAKEPIEFEMTIDRSLLKNANFLSARMMMKNIETFSQCLNQCFVSKFNGYSLPYKNLVFVGGGTGFASKTVLNSMLGYEEGLDVTSKILNRKFPGEHKHMEDHVVSPHTIKCTSHKGMLCQMGLCRIKIY